MGVGGGVNHLNVLKAVPEFKLPQLLPPDRQIRRTWPGFGNPR